jgi:hypothetical protein
MEPKEGNKQSLEMEFNIPGVISSEYKILQQDKEWFYKMIVRNIRFNGMSVYVDFALQKNIKIQFKGHKKIISLVPFRRKFVSGEVIDKNIWEINDNNVWFISSGKPIKDRTLSFGMRAAIVGKLAGINVLVSDELLDSILSPIEERIIMLLKIINTFPK